MLKSSLFKKSKLSLSVVLLISLASCTTTASVPVSPYSNNSPSSVNTQTTNSDSSKPVPYVNSGSGRDSTPSSSSEGSMSAGGASSSVIPASAPTEKTTGSTADLSSTPDPYTSTNSVTPDKYINNPQPTKSLSGGSSDDNEKFDDYLSYLNKFSTLRDGIDVLKVDVSNRFTISLLDSNNKTISDADIQIKYNSNNVFSGKTYSNGKVLFFPSSIKSINSNCQQQNCTDKYTVTAQKGNYKVSKDFSSSDKNWNINIGDKRDEIKTPNLDLLFLIDTTGSMGDEINSIQKTIKDVSNQIQNMPSNPKIRYSLVSYKDRVDDYRVKRYDFTTNLSYFQSELDELKAGGGGDYPESMNEGLYNAISKVSWTTDNAIRLVFLVADAPPHLDYSDDVKYTDSMVNAVKQGIKIYPTAASGLDNSGEYIFRQMAQFTGAKFLFITYGGDAQTAGTTPNHVGYFKENNLDSLIVNVVKDELTNLN
ncbi:MAG: VWA domain-containing protein [Candidatus Sericytochromatia bacterium]|nr:VWA domain-containing protein [Candidatus Sericytochromatia bacterium]